MSKKKRKVTISWRDLLDYCLMVKRSENSADLTIRDYESKVTRFFEWLEAGQNGLSIEQIDSDIPRRYIDYLLHHHIQNSKHPYKQDKSKTKGLSPVIVNIHITYLKAFFSFVQRENHIPSSPFSGIRKLKVDTDRVDSLEKDEVKLLLAQINRTTYAGLRDYAILMLMIDTGIRIGELLKLLLEDFDAQQCHIVIRPEVSKTRKTRILPVSPIVAKYIIRIEQQRDQEWDGNYLFTTYEGHQLGLSSFRKRLKAYAERAGISKRIYPYLMRHTFSLLYLTLNEGDPFSLQRMLGHSSMTMTRRYVNLKDKDLKKKHLLHSPIDGLFKSENKKRKRPILHDKH